MECPKPAWVSGGRLVDLWIQGPHGSHFGKLQAMQLTVAMTMTVTMIFHVLPQPQFLSLQDSQVM